jgi:hypothetical protein
LVASSDGVERAARSAAGETSHRTIRSVGAVGAPAQTIEAKEFDERALMELQ